MEMNRIFDAAIFVSGVALLALAYNATHTPLEDFTSRYSNETMWFYTSGTAAVIGGVMRSTLGGRK